MNNKVEIRIQKINSIGANEFRKLIEDPKVHLQFLRNRLRIESKDNLNNILAEIDSISSDVYHVEVLTSDTTCIIYFWSTADFSNFRK